MRLFLLLFSISVFIGCDSVIEEDRMPYTSFESIRINLSNIEYYDLNTKGFVFLEGGVQGIILYKSPFGNEYRAFERNCSYNPYDDCVKVEVDDSGLYMIDPCCGSQFNFEQGAPIGGPAIFSLRRYQIYLDGNFLTITDEPLQ